MEKRLARIGILIACEFAVGGLGWWQYRSIDALSRTETQVLKSAMRERAMAFVESFDRQIQELISALAPGTIGDSETAAKSLAESLDQWRGNATDAGVLREVWSGSRIQGVAATAQSQRMWRKLHGQQWVPEAARAGVAKLCADTTVDQGSPLRIEAPAIVLPLLSGPSVAGQPPHGCLIALLDAERLRGHMVEALIRKHVTGADQDRYFYVIRDLAEGKTISGQRRGEPEVRLPFLFAKQDLLGPAMPPPSSLPPGALPSRQAVIIPLVAQAATKPHWELLLGPIGGSIEEQVGSTRRLNLAVTWTLSAALGIAMIAILRALERSEQLQAQQSQFVAAVSHELRSPLAAIRTLAQNQADGMVTDTAQTSEYGRLLMGEADRLHSTFEHCLAFAGVRSVAAIPTARVDAAETARTVCAQVTAQHPDLKITVQGEAHIFVLCSRELLAQALHNLLDNARKFARPGEAVAEVSVVRDGDGVVIAVRDEGTGILPEEVSHLGTPFFRGRYARDGQIAGLGLGLSLARSFAERSGGQLRIVREDTGFTVRLTLPLA